MSPLPSIDIVVIGLNTEKTIKACLESIAASHYPNNLIKVFYVDGNSSDQSRSLAESLGAQVITVTSETPTPGRQRNAGWKMGTGELVQFLDSDTQMDPDWLTKAVEVLVAEVGAVCGQRSELYPDKSIFNWIGDLEWNPPAGEAEAFGGDVLIKRSLLESTGGYNDDLIAGEDPELAYRCRQGGSLILRLPVKMTAHDLAMYSLKQYWKRAYRSGHAYAEVNHKHPHFWAADIKRILIRGAAPYAAVLFILPVFFGFYGSLLLSLGAILFFTRPRWNLLGYFEKTLNLKSRGAKIYSWHAVFVVIPQFWGALRYYAGQLLGKPLTNRRVLNLKSLTEV